MRMSPRSRWGTRSAMLLSTTAAGTISQTARGFLSLATRSASEAAPTAFSRARSATAFSDMSKTTHSWPPLINRRTIFAPILPNPIIASCMTCFSTNPFSFVLDARSGRALGLLPSPLWGGAGGGGPSADHRTTPTPALRADPPHKGEGRTEFVARDDPISPNSSLALNRIPQPRHGGGDALAVVENRRSRHQHIGARGDRPRRRSRVDPSIHLEAAGRPDAFDHLARTRNLRERRREEMLTSETRVHGHDQHLVEVRHDVLEYARRRCRINGDTGAFSQCLDPLHGA